MPVVDSKISWTDSTWNPSTGCTRVSEGCNSCYAFALHDARHIAWKRGKMPNAPVQYHLPYSQIQLLPDRLRQPFEWKRGRRIFVDSMSDLFHEQVPIDYIAEVWTVMMLCRQHTFQVLTKRAKRMHDVLDSYYFQELVGRNVMAQGLDFLWPADNIWLGVSTENEATLRERVPILQKTPAALTFISAEPLLEGLPSLPRFLVHHGAACRGFSGGIICGEPRGLDWVISGGESGPHFRPADLDWFRAIRDDCRRARVAHWFKQSANRLPGRGVELDGETIHEFPDEGLSKQLLALRSPRREVWRSR